MARRACIYGSRLEMDGLSRETQAILLLTAPLIVGQGRDSLRPLSLGEYKTLARGLHAAGKSPASFLEEPAVDLLSVSGCERFDAQRVEALLGRGLLLSQAVDKWRARSIWVLSRADSDYPWRFKKRLGQDAPPVLYGCGDARLLGGGGLAVLGSRSVGPALISYTRDVGALVARSGRAVVSGGARGVDQAAMIGCLDEGGEASGVLADSLGRAALDSAYLAPLREERLVLVSPYDPSARFNVGHAMQRNKYVYALADAALIVNADLGRGGTWAGAIEQLDKWRFARLFARSTGEPSRGLGALIDRGVASWPNPQTREEFCALLDGGAEESSDPPRQARLF